MAINNEPNAMLAYLGPIAPSMMKPNVETNRPIANAHGVSNKISIEKAATAKQIKVRKRAFILPVKLSSLSASAAAMTPRIRGVINVFCWKYHAGITTPSKVIRIRML